MWTLPISAAFQFRTGPTFCFDSIWSAFLLLLYCHNLISLHLIAFMKVCQDLDSIASISLSQHPVSSAWAWVNIQYHVGAGHLSSFTFLLLVVLSWAPQSSSPSLALWLFLGTSLPPTVAALLSLLPVRCSHPGKLLLPIPLLSLSLTFFFCVSQSSSFSLVCSTLLLISQDTEHEKFKNQKE